MTENVKMFKNLFPTCEVEMIDPSTSPKELTNHYFTLLEEGKNKGFHPVIVVANDILLEKFELDLEDEDLDFTADEMEKYRGNILLKAQEIDAKNLYNEEKKELRSELEEVAFEEPDHSIELISFRDLDQETALVDEVVIIKIPTDSPHEVLAWLPMGGFNECPSPEMMTAMAKHWYETYGAMPVAITHDVVEFYTPTPPSDKETLYDLAMEQFLFDVDIVEQGVGCVEALVEVLYKNKTWYFWWD